MSVSNVSARPRRWASPAVVAEYLGCTVRTVERRALAGEITAYKVGHGRMVRFDLNEIDELVEHGALVTNQRRPALEEYVDKVVSGWPELTADQRDRLAVLLRGDAA